MKKYNINITNLLKDMFLVFCLIITSTFVYANPRVTTVEMQDGVRSSYSDYMTDEFGNVNISINVIGHVKAPGMHIINQNANILDILAASGGFLPGSDLSKVQVFKKNGKKITLNLESFFESGKKIDLEFDPNDTIYIKQDFSLYLLNTSAYINIVLSILNIIIMSNNIN